MADERGFHVQQLVPGQLDAWVELRGLLWPEGSPAERRAEAQDLLGRRAAVFLASSPEAETIGFAEATVRADYVNGCSTSPVAFLEGLYVQPAWRRRGVARALCVGVQAWAVAQGCTELASDTEVDNIVSQRLHAALGFEETERVVCFRRRVEPG